MRILLVSTAYPLRGGIAHANALLARALARRHEVETITFKRQYPSFLFPGTRQTEDDAVPFVPPAPQWMDSINPLNWVVVGRKIRRRPPDVLLFRFWNPFFAPCFGTIARVATWGTQTRVGVVCDNIIPHERLPFGRALTKYFFRAVDFFIVQSHAVEHDLNTFRPGVLHRMVPHPVYEVFGPRQPREEARRALGITAPRVLLFFGYLRRYKGLHVLLDAMAKVHRSLGVHLLVVGESYEDLAGVHDQVRALGLGDRVTLKTEYVPNSDVPRYFSAADAVALPYLSATQSGIAQLAYNFDLPVIVTDVGGLAEVVEEGKTGLVVPPGDAPAFARAIERLFGDPAFAEYAGRVASAKLRYSPDAFVDAIESMAGGAA